MTLLRMSHCDITLGNDVAKNIHCDVTMDNDIAMCTCRVITKHNDIKINIQSKVVQHKNKNKFVVIICGDHVHCFWWRY